MRKNAYKLVLKDLNVLGPDPGDYLRLFRLARKNNTKNVGIFKTSRALSSNLGLNQDPDPKRSGTLDPNLGGN